MSTQSQPSIKAPSAAEAEKPASRARRISGEKALDFAERYGLVMLLIGLIVLFSVLPSTSSTFPTSTNINTIVGNQSVLAIIALASIVPLLTGQFDLSVAAILGVSGVVVAACTNDLGLPLGVAIVAALAFGLLIGLINGVLVAYVGINSLIGTLGMTTLLFGVASAYTATPIVEVPAQLTRFGSGKWLDLPSMLFVLVVFAAVLYWLLDYTPYGRRLTAIGSSVSAARLVGINVRRVVLSSYLLSGTVAAAAGVFQIGRSGAADATVGNSFLLPAIAAAFLGATTIRPGRFNIIGTLVAIFFLAVAVSGLTLAGLESWIQDVFNGLALIIGVGISAVIGKRRQGAEAV
ncbi:MAG: ABC transporter permease [Actinobacteria bacterium]|nr:ABC transporter permease [Actinomycetota bacterium]